MNKFSLSVLLAGMLFSCETRSQLSEIMILPKSLKENSAIEATANPDLYWTIMDSGNEPNLYGIDKNGNIKTTIAIAAKNTDWEELSSDDQGNIYIGDIGNNNNVRRDLCILKIMNADLDKSQASVAQKTSFYFPEQKEFPPKKSGLYYDVEAFFYHAGNFYIFTKNKSSKHAGFTYVYRVPAKSGKFAAKLLGKIETCDQHSLCAIAAADMSPDGKKIALLSKSYVWIVSDFSGDDYVHGKVRQIDLGSITQKEGLCFSDNDHILISDEREGGTGGKVYMLNLADLKSEP